MKNREKLQTPENNSEQIPNEPGYQKENQGTALANSSEILLKNQENQGKELGELMAGVMNNPNISEKEKKLLAERSAKMIEDYGETAQTALETAEKMSYSLVNMTQNAINRASETGNKAIKEVGGGIAHVGAAVIEKTLGAIGKGVGQGASGFVTNFVEGIRKGFSGK